jgi:hypothetical protein
MYLKYSRNKKNAFLNHTHFFHIVIITIITSYRLGGIPAVLYLKSWRKT